MWSENRIMRKGTGVSRKEKEGIRGNEINKVIYEEISLCICDTAFADLGIIM